MMPGIQGEVILGDYEHLQGVFIKSDMKDFILGCSFLIIAVVMLFCCFSFQSIQYPAGCL